MQPFLSGFFLQAHCLSRFLPPVTCTHGLAPFFVEQDSWDGYTTMDFSLLPVMDIWFTSSFQLQEECTVIEEYTHAVTRWICSRDLMPSVGIIVNKSISYTWKLPRLHLKKKKKKGKYQWLLRPVFSIADPNDLGKYNLHRSNQEKKPSIMHNRILF